MEVFNWRCFRVLLRATGRSLDDLAEDMGVTKQTISAWKSGRSVPTLNSLSLIAKFFKIPMEDLMVESNEIRLDDDNQNTEAVEGVV